MTVHTSTRGQTAPGVERRSLDQRSCSSRRPQARGRHASSSNTRVWDRIGGGAVSVDDLPEGVLATDPVVRELEQVAAAHLDGFARDLGATDRPFGYAAITACPMAIVAVVDIWNPVESGLDPART